MRPDEFAATDSERWTEAVQIRRAYEEGVAGAQKEKQMRDRLMGGEAAEVG